MYADIRPNFPLIENGNVEAYALSHFKMGKMRGELGNYVGGRWGGTRYIQMLK